ADLGSVSQILSQLPYGAEEQTLPRVALDAPPAFVPRYEFTGKERDRGVGLAYFGARSLDARLGRWVSADPLAVQGLVEADNDTYRPCHNSPVLLVDPDGQQSVDAGIVSPPVEEPAPVADAGTACAGATEGPDPAADPADAFAPAPAGYPHGVHGGEPLPTNTPEGLVAGAIGALGSPETGEVVSDIVDPLVRAGTAVNEALDAPASAVADVVESVAEFVVEDVVGAELSDTAREYIRAAAKGVVYGLEATVLSRIFRGAAEPPSPRVGEPRIVFDETAWQHIADRHVPGGTMTEGRSVFLDADTARQAIRQAETAPAVRQANGNLARTLQSTTGPVGIDRATGTLTRTYTVITTPDGVLVTAFPGAP
ncbi:RHS repeat-associated core domain-containing protein, partial [Candidatus Fermentibacteria bacterium]|nr:RHS repeat-associated core domain-containing protein [Candidatus Fermentibacteria bacterium]